MASLPTPNEFIVDKDCRSLPNFNGRKKRKEKEMLVSVQGKPVLKAFKTLQ